MLKASDLRILFDRNVPYQLSPYLAEHDVRTVAEQGWSRFENGELLSVAEASGFYLMVTSDQSIEYQQNLRGRKLALVVLSTNHIDILQAHTEKLVGAIDRAKVGSFEFVKYDLPPKRRPSAPMY